MKIKEQKLYESAQFEPGKLYRYVDNDLGRQPPKQTVSLYS
jgi:hypothetical protein